MLIFKIYQIFVINDDDDIKRISVGKNLCRMQIAFTNVNRISFTAFARTNCVMGYHVLAAMRKYRSIEQD